MDVLIVLTLFLVDIVAARIHLHVVSIVYDHESGDKNIYQSNVTPFVFVKTFS